MRGKAKIKFLYFFPLLNKLNEKYKKIDGIVNDVINKEAIISL
jgi:hypothetical protein